MAKCLSLKAALQQRWRRPKGASHSSSHSRLHRGCTAALCPSSPWAQTWGMRRWHSGTSLVLWLPHISFAWQTEVKPQWYFHWGVSDCSPPIWIFSMSTFQEKPSGRARRTSPEHCGHPEQLGSEAKVPSPAVFNLLKYYFPQYLTIWTKPGRFGIFSAQDSWSILKPLYPWKTKRGFMITHPLMILETRQGWKLTNEWRSENGGEILSIKVWEPVIQS